MKDKIQVIDNYLENKYLVDINSFVLSNNFDWYLQGVTTDDDPKYKQFVHIFYKNHNFTSIHKELVYPILNKINPLSIFRIKLNLLTKTEKIIEHPFHTDHLSENLISSILYLNTNNGYTKFKTLKKNIYSKSNRLVTFKSNQLHHGTTCTDENFRLVLNIIYLKNI